MAATLAIIFASIIDLPSIISIIGSIKAKKIWQVLLIAFCAAIFGEFLGAAIGSVREPLAHFPYQLIAQIIVAVSVFTMAQAIRKRNADNPKSAKIKLVLLGIALFVLFGGAVAGMTYSAFKKSETNLKAAMERTELSKINERVSVNPASIDAPKRVEKQGDGSVLLYREPVEIYWNDWTGRALSRGKIYISAEGKTVTFDGIIQLNCDNRWGYVWRTASKGSHERRMTDIELKELVPAQVIPAAFKMFCATK